MLHLRSPSGALALVGNGVRAGVTGAAGADGSTERELTTAGGLCRRGAIAHRPNIIIIIIIISCPWYLVFLVLAIACSSSELGRTRSSRA